VATVLSTPASSLSLVSVKKEKELKNKPQNKAKQTQLKHDSRNEEFTVVL